MPELCVEALPQIRRGSERRGTRVYRQKTRGLRTAAPRPAAFPRCYGETQVSLMEVGARWLYVHWEAREGDLARVRRELGEQGELALRLYDVTCIMFDGCNANEWFDVVVGEECDSWYISLWSAGRSLVADLGLRGSRGNFVALARSNCVQTPRAFSDSGPEEWMHVEQDPRKRQKVETEHFAPKKVIPIWENRVVELQSIASERIMASIGCEEVKEFYAELFEAATGCVGGTAEMAGSLDAFRRRAAGGGSAA